MKPLLLITLTLTQIVTNNATPKTVEKLCNTDQIENHLSKLEAQLEEKLEDVRSELQENTRRLQALEWRNARGLSDLERFRAEISQIARSGRGDPLVKQLQQQLGHLLKGTNLLVAATRNLAKDVLQIKQSLSSVNLLQSDTKNQLTKQYLHEELPEVRHKHKYQTRDVSSIRDKPFAKHCTELQQKGFDSGIYLIKPDEAPKPFMVLCDMELTGGGWTTIHHRFGGIQDFYLSWRDYKRGFGNIAGEFWLGLDHIHEMTGNEVHELLVELTDAENETRYAHYSAFSVASESEGFVLKVLGGYEGDAGDSLLYHGGRRFSTKDVDQDDWPEGSCAQSHGGAWWYGSCDTSNLNGKYLGPGELPDSYLYNGMYWGTFKGPSYSLQRSRMLIKPRDGNSPPILPPGRSLSKIFT